MAAPPPTTPRRWRRRSRATVVGRISPAGKRAVVAALRDQGRYVAMLGDGVNDVPALKEARLAIAQGSGAQMAKSVADLVLVRGDFSAVPQMVAEGRQILRNLQRVAKLYVTKSAFASFLILTVGTTATAYPLIPRHFSLAASLTIGIPSFLLALAPSSGSWETRGFLRRVSRFAVPAGAAAGIGVVSSYQFALNALDLPLLEARTVAISVLVLVGLYLILALEGVGGRRGRLIGARMSLALLLAYAGTLALASTRVLRAGGAECRDRRPPPWSGLRSPWPGWSSWGCARRESFPVLDGMPEPKVGEQPGDGGQPERKGTVGEDRDDCQSGRSLRMRERQRSCPPPRRRRRPATAAGCPASRRSRPLRSRQQAEPLRTRESTPTGPRCRSPTRPPRRAEPGCRSGACRWRPGPPRQRQPRPAASAAQPPSRVWPSRRRRDTVIEVAGQQRGYKPAGNDEAPEGRRHDGHPNGAGPGSRPLRNPTPQSTSATM